MIPPDEWNRLDAIAYRLSVTRSVRRMGWILAGVGALVATIGLLAPVVQFAVIGVVLAIAGAWNAWRPSVSGMLVDGGALIGTGLLNLFAWNLVPDASATSMGKWAITGVLQIAWGVQRLALHRTARRAVVDPEAMARLDSMIREISKRRLRDDPGVVEFRTGRFNMQRARLGLLPEGVVAVFGHEAVRLERRPDITIDARGSTWLGRSIKVVLRMSDLELTGEMPTAHVERFEQWKLGVAPPRAIAA